MRKEYLSDRNVTTCYVMCSDEDQPIVEELCAGISVRGELVVSVENIDYEDERYYCWTRAVVRKDDTRRLARRHKVDVRALPRFISECMSEWREIINPNFREVEACFKEITECLLDEGCRFRIERKFGPGGFMCC